MNRCEAGETLTQRYYENGGCLFVAFGPKGMGHLGACALNGAAKRGFLRERVHWQQHCLGNSFSLKLIVAASRYKMGPRNLLEKSTE